MITSSTNLNTSSLYNKVSNTDITTNKKYLANAYSSSQPKVQYYNADDEKTKQKKKVKKGAVIAATAIASLAVVGAAVASAVSNKNMSKFLDEKNIKEVSENIKNSGIFNKVSSFMANVNPVKDDVFERGADYFKKKNIPLLKHLEKYCSGTKSFYRNILHKFQKGNYERAAAVLRKEGVQVENFDEWFKRLDKSVTKNLKGDKYFTEGLLNKDLFRKMTTSNIADDILMKDGGFRKIAGNVTTSAKLSKEGQEALEALNKTRGTIASKLRDINAGSAATDFVTMIFSALGLTTAIATSETKEERKSIAVNLGVPLLTTLSCSALLGNIFAISGAKSLLFSLAAGQLASKGAKIIDKNVLHPNDNKNQNV